MLPLVQHAPLAVMAGATRHPWPRIDGCRTPSGITDRHTR